MDIEKIRKLANEYYEKYKQKKEIENRLREIRNVFINDLGEGIHDFGNVEIWVRKFKQVRFNTKKFKDENRDIAQFYEYENEFMRVDVIKKGDGDGL